MSYRLQLLLTVAAVALAAAGTVVGVTLATRDRPSRLHPQAGKPPVPARLPGAAGAAVEQAFAGWPHGSIPRFQRLERDYPKDALVQFYVGLAYAWAGYTQAAVAPLERAKKLGRDTPTEVSADSLLHPQFYPGDPPFQLSAGAGPLLERGAALEQSGHRHSAERFFLRAARLRPDDPEALAAAAFGRFDKSNLNAAFSRMGPLAKRFPASQSVHYNLGLLLVWIGEGDAAVAQFRRTQALGPHTPFGAGARKFLRAIAEAGTGTPKK